jgi:PAS domain S-box-containing protein
MSLGTGAGSSVKERRSEIVVLAVDDDREFLELTAELLTREDDRFTVVTETSASDGIERLVAEDIDCVVSDYDMPEMNGIEFLRTVREEDSDFPFILFTGKGSEEIASDAISAGVTDYLQKGAETDRHELLATRIDAAVSQYRTEHRLERQNALFAKAQDIADVGAWEYGVVSDSAHLSDEAMRIHGLSPEETLTPETSIEYYHPDDRAAVRDAFTRAVEAGESYDLTVRLITEDGTQRWVRTRGEPESENGDVVRVRGTIQDITERKERERQLRATKRRLDAILEYTTTPMFMKDDEGRYILVNRAYKDVFDIDGEIVGQTAHDIYPSDFADHIQESDDAVLESGEPIEFESQEVLQSEERAFLTTVVPIYDTGERADPERPVAVFGVASDITDLKRRERELKRERDRLDEFANVISHDLRSPLNVATARLELASEECDSTHLGDAVDALERIETLIDDVLAVAREGRPVRETEVVALPEAARDCWSVVETADATLQVDAEHSIRADSSRLKQLLENLVRNAIEHGGDDVTVTIGELPDGFYVADDGFGIAADERAKVFEAGHSTTEGGTGFGLNIVHEIVEAHGWKISITDSDAGGARFEITGVDIVGC